MARSPLILAASVSAAVAGAEAVSASPLTTGSAGRNDAAVVTLGDRRNVVVRLPLDESATSDLATEAIALRALTAGARALVGFTIPEYLGSAPTPDGPVHVTTFVPGYQVDTAYIPAGRGVASSIGTTLAQIHALPSSIVRNAGLPQRTAAEVRDDLDRLVEEAAATGRVPVRLMVRWREAIENDALWQFEPTVTLGGAGALSFVYRDLDEVPTVVGVIDWHALSVTDPALDLQFLQSAPEAASSVVESYHASAHRAGDEYLLARSRLYAELEFARWLLHGRDAQDESVIEDAGAMLDSLAENIRNDDLIPAGDRPDLDDALAALSQVPTPERVVDTSMHTDTYDPQELALSGVSLSDDEEIDQAREARMTAAQEDTQALGVNDTQALTPSDTQSLTPNDTQGLSAAETQPFADSQPIAESRVDTGPALASLMQEETQPFGLAPLAADDPDATRPEGTYSTAELTQAEAQRAARAAINRWKVDPS